MSKKPASPAPRVRTSEDKLYQACLDACIEGIESLPVDKRRDSTVVDPNNNLTKLNLTTTATNALTAFVTRKYNQTECAVTSPSQEECTTSLISPSATPQRVSSPAHTHLTLADTEMNRSSLHGAPMRGQVAPTRGPAHAGQPTFGSHDARSNLAVQPAANTGSFKLKKNAVKIVGAPASSSPLRAAPAKFATTPVGGSSPVPGPVKAKPKVLDRLEPAKPAAQSNHPTPASTPTASKIDPPIPSVKEEAALDDLFARLNARASTPTQTIIVKDEVPTTPKNDLSLFEDRLNAKDTPVVQEKKSDPVKETTRADVLENREQDATRSQPDIEQLYLKKATAYLQALSNVENVAVQTIKTVSTKLQSSYALDTKLNVDEIDKLKARYTFAVLKHVNQVSKKNAKPVTADFVKKILQDSDGNMLVLYAKLVEEECLSLEDIDGITALCRSILNILPKAESTALTATTASKPTSTSIDETKSEAKDPMDNRKAWPTQEKRETPAAFRSCILKGVSGVKNINELQALVWGGRLESIAMPVPGSEFAVVRFLTPEACDKYFKATENGIEVQGDKKTVIFVEKQPGPSSINDVMRNCIEGDASRCVRALDAEEGWSDQKLMKLARGQGASKREVDRIKQGKTARGRYYIEFRFANIYHALSFKRQLTDDVDWEHCTINYGTDPCDTARGVHYQDEDEEGAGSLA